MYFNKPQLDLYHINLNHLVQNCELVNLFLTLLSPSLSPQASIAHSSFNVLVRWAAFCPFHNLQQQHHSLSLLGGPAPNPEDMLVFQAGDIVGTGSQGSVANLQGGTLSFNFRHSKKVRKRMKFVITFAGAGKIPCFSSLLMYLLYLEVVCGMLVHPLRFFE